MSDDRSFFKRIIDGIEHVFYDDDIDGCEELSHLPEDRRVRDEDVAILVLTAGIEDRTDEAAIAQRLNEYAELFNTTGEEVTDV